MDIPKIFIPDDEKFLEGHVQYLLKEPKLEPTELLKINGRLYTVLTHSCKAKTEMERNLSDYHFSHRFKIIKLVEYEKFQKNFKNGKTGQKQP